MYLTTIYTAIIDPTYACYRNIEKKTRLLLRTLFLYRIKDIDTKREYLIYPAFLYVINVYCERCTGVQSVLQPADPTVPRVRGNADLPRRQPSKQHHRPSQVNLMHLYN